MSSGALTLLLTVLGKRGALLAAALLAAAINLGYSIPASAAVAARPAAAVQAATGTCTSATVAPFDMSPVKAGSMVRVYAQFTGCPDGPLIRWWVRYLDGVWRITQDWSTSTYFPWSTAGLAPGTYQLGIWIKDALSTTTYDTYALVSYQLSDPGCTSVAVNPDITSPSGVGTTVNFTANAVSCNLPLYQWWVRDAGGSWSVPAGHDFAHSSATFIWSTAGLPAGTYQIGVWARDQQSLATYDAYGITTYELLGTGTTGGACTAVSLASQQSPQTSGNPITLDAAAYGCAKAGFRFWIRDLSGNWSWIPYYSASYTMTTASYQWNASGYAPGTYLLGVWAEELPSPPNVAFESYSIVTQVILPGNACSTASLATTVPSPQTSGTVISVSATVAGALLGYCSQPEFRFFIAAPGSGFVEKQAYSPNSGFTWTTTGLPAGVYQLGVWAREQGDGSAYDTYAIVSYQLSG